MTGPTRPPGEDAWPGGAMASVPGLTPWVSKSEIRPFTWNRAMEGSATAEGTGRHPGGGGASTGP